jgi:hypothetical protein
LSLDDELKERRMVDRGVIKCVGLKRGVFERECKIEYNFKSRQVHCSIFVASPTGQFNATILRHIALHYSKSICIQIGHAWRGSLFICLRYLVSSSMLDDLCNYYMLKLQSDYHLDASTLLK